MDKAKKILILNLFSSILPILFSTFFSCTTTEQTIETKKKRYHSCEFIVLSDPHLYDNSLGITGSAFEKNMNKNNKLFQDSKEIIFSAVQMVISMKPDFVIIPGDLTKDGEYLSHLLFTKYLSEIENAGIEVYVVPGNHDILNNNAMRYDGDKQTRVKNVTPEEFLQLYAEFGYIEAIYLDEDSLSYVIEPIDGLWFLALDSCIYEQLGDTSISKTGGRFSQLTINWIKEMLLLANKKQKAIIAFMHHSILEHFNYQKTYFPDYVLDNYQVVAKLLAKNNVNLVFTGHFHAQDVAFKTWEEGKYFLYDIETGSLVTYPCPLRLITINEDQQLAFIQSFYIEKTATHGSNFLNYAHYSLERNIKNLATDILPDYGFLKSDAEILACLGAEIVINHYKGDEPPNRQLKTRGLGCCAQFIISTQHNIITALLNDPPPPDNELIIDLASGEWR